MWREQKISDICSIYGIPDNSEKGVRAYKIVGLKKLAPKKPGPVHNSNCISRKLELKIITLKQKHPSWGARRIKFQHDLPCHWITVHRVIKHHGLLVRIKPKPQPSKRFQRRHVDSMWQGDTFHFRISGTGRVCVTGFMDDRSRFRWCQVHTCTKAEKNQ